MRIGIICPSEIAFRRFMPALQGNEDFQFVGLAVSQCGRKISKDIPDSSVVESVINAEYRKS